MELNRYANNNYEHVLNAIYKIQEIMNKPMDADGCTHYTEEEWLIFNHPEAYLSMAFVADYDDEHLESLINCLKGVKWK